MHRNETPYVNWIKYRRVLGVLDAITYTNYGHDQWMSFGVDGVQYCLSSWAFVVVLITLPHYRASV